MDNIKKYQELNKKVECITYQLPNNEKHIMNKVLKIDPELRDLLPSLSEEEFKKLEERILKDGCQTPLFTWQGYIADGHNRYSICTKYNIQFQSIELGYKEKSEVMHWMIDTQLGRRNLSIIQRISVAEKYRDKLKEEAKERYENNVGRPSNENRTPKGAQLSEKKKTSKELAKLAEVGSGTMARYEYVMNNGDEDLKKKMLNDEIPITAAYDLLQQKKKQSEQLKQKEENKTNIEQKSAQISKNKNKECLKCGLEKPIDNFYIRHDKCKDCESKIDIKIPSKGEVFKDIQGNPLPINQDLFDDEKMDEILVDIKTPKNVFDYMNPIDEIEWVKMVCNDLVEQLDDKFFNLHRLIEKMSNEHQVIVSNILNEHVDNINIIKSKILNNKKENELI